MGNKQTKKLFLIVFSFCFICSFFVFTSQSFATTTCDQKYPDGVCKDKCDEAILRGELEDKAAGLCTGTQVCCHEKAAYIDYELNVPLPAGFGTSGELTKPKGLAQYIAHIFGLSLYVIVPLAMFVLMYAGVKWILAAGNPGKIGEAKKYIFNALIGLTLAILSYSILALFGLTEIQEIAVDVSYMKQVEEIDWTTYLDILGYTPGGGGGGGGSFKPGDLDALIKDTASRYGIEYCLLAAMVELETGHGANPNSLGHDENGIDQNAKDCCNPSKRAYLRLGVRYDGSTFTPRTGLRCSRGSGACNVRDNNTDKPICSTPPEYCLDWRFGHGFGLSQFTIFGKESHPKWNAGGDGSWCLKDSSGKLIPSRQEFGKCWTLQEGLDPNKSLDFGAAHLKARGSTVRSKFARYNGSLTTDPYATTGCAKYQACCADTGSCAGNCD